MEREGEREDIFYCFLHVITLNRTHVLSKMKIELEQLENWDVVVDRKSLVVRLSTKELFDGSPVQVWSIPYAC